MYVLEFSEKPNRESEIQKKTDTQTETDQLM